MNDTILELADVIDSLHATPEYLSVGVPMVRVVDINNNFLKLDNCFLVDQETCDRHNKNHIPQKGDVIITRVGSYGMLAYVDIDSRFCLGQNIAIISPYEAEDGKFLYYYLKSPYIQNIIYGNSGGSSYKCIGLEQIKKLPLMIEGIEYRRIGDLLYQIDCKIENNRKINEELDRAARTIYDYWFLQFDFPDESGKPYKSSGGKMVWNEELKREIPEGWKVKRIKDCVKHINTGLNPRDNFVLGQGDIKYVTVKNLMSNGTLDFASCDTIDSRAKKIIHKRSDVAKGDILFASIAPLGRCFIVQEEPEKWDINESVFSIRPNIDMVSKEYLYLFFISQAFVRLAEFSSTGSVFYGIRISTLENMQIIIPDEDTMQKFTNYTSDILYKKYLNFIGNHELASLRDFLLPLLMNGQVGFKEC